MREQNFKYVYDGPVLEFDRVITERWRATTFAPSERKARSNFTYQFKKQFGKDPATKINLAGEIRLVG